MGLLTNPSTNESNKIVAFLEKHDSKLSLLSYLGGIIWLVFLANAEYNLRTYFSENALLPGLVVENFAGGHRGDNYLKELITQDNTDVGITPEYFKSAFHRIGLREVELQNYTLRDTISKTASSQGVNVFAILRAKRAAGTESVVFNAPFFPKHSSQRKNLASIALMFALAEYFQEQVYWAKDIVFLIAEGHIGTLAWVKGHQEMFDHTDYLQIESVKMKAGNIQAAVNVVMEGNNVCSLETRFHGVNGQLPNLDFVNLLNKFIVSESEKRADWEKDVWKLLNYVQTQATGSPSGSHGFFLKYGIESVTLAGRASKACKGRSVLGFGDMGRMLEAVFRSLNNLLERLHQSFFFYLKTTPNRFISISLYFPPLAMIVFPICLKGTSFWLTKKELDGSQSLLRLIVVHVITVGFRWLLDNLDLVLKATGYNNLILSKDQFFQLLLIMGGMIYCCTAIIFRNAKESLRNGTYCLVLLELATTLYSLALFNPSLVILIGVILSPLLTMIFKFEPKQRLWLFGLITATIVGLIINYYDMLVLPVNKFYYESTIYGNFLFDYSFLFLLPVVSVVATLA